jgi:hypothetical protein
MNKNGKKNKEDIKENVIQEKEEVNRIQSFGMAVSVPLSFSFLFLCYLMPQIWQIFS